MARKDRERLLTLPRAVVMTLRPTSLRGVCGIGTGLVALALLVLSLLAPQGETLAASTASSTPTPLTAPTVTATVGSPSAVTVPSSALNSKHQPNDSLDVIPAGNYDSTSLFDATSATGPWMVFWPTGTTSMAFSSTPFPGPNETTNDNGPVIPSSFTWDNGGGWVNSVYRLGPNTLVAFFHAEHHYGCADSPPELCPYATADGKGDFWASAGVAYSYDNGQTWGQAAQFLTASQPQPATPTLGGVNFQTVVWDFQTHQWVAFYGCDGGFSCEAVSSDPSGRPGTWFNYVNGSFSQPALGSDGTALPGFAHLGGVLYSVQYDASLGVWIGWGREATTGGVYITASRDLVNWSTPQQVFNGPLTMYPIMVGSQGTQVVGTAGLLYYVTGAEQGTPVLWSVPVSLHLG
jgi:hypothetical protein